MGQNHIGGTSDLKARLLPQPEKPILPSARAGSALSAFALKLESPSNYHGYAKRRPINRPPREVVELESTSCSKSRRQGDGG